MCSMRSRLVYGRDPVVHEAEAGAEPEAGRIGAA